MPKSLQYNFRGLYIFQVQDIVETVLYKPISAVSGDKHL
jgi:hypothetical protein